MRTPKAYQRDHLSRILMITHLGVGFALRCFQRLSKSGHSYPALLLAEQQVDQWSVHSGPLVLGTTLLNNRRLQ